MRGPAIQTKLVNHYIESLGARVIYSYNRMRIFTASAKFLINSYYRKYFNVR
jgi:hypothetical protein